MFGLVFLAIVMPMIQAGDSAGITGDVAARHEVTERQVTTAAHGHILTNVGVWSPDSRWVVYDCRSDKEGSVFDGTRIERVHVETGRVEVLYESRHGAGCGVVTYHPARDEVVFILGPEHPTEDWAYAAYHRQGVIVQTAAPGRAIPLDARDLVPPFTPGALRGGSHVHVFSPDGGWVSFTYEDHLLATAGGRPVGAEPNARNIGVSLIGRPVRVRSGHPRNHDGTAFSVVVTRTVESPRPGSDDITRAFEDAWVGTHGYRRADGTRQPRALAFQGELVNERGDRISEVFIVDLPEDVTRAGSGPLEGTTLNMPRPPNGAAQRRLTRTDGRPFPGIQGPRHWPRSSPDGERIAFLMRDGQGIVQLWTVSPRGGEPVQVTRNTWDIGSAFTWSPDGRWIAHVMDNSVFATDVDSGQSRRLTPRCGDDEAPLPLACVVAPDGRKIAYLRRVAAGGEAHNQVFVAFLDAAASGGVLTTRAGEDS